MEGNDKIFEVLETIKSKRKEDGISQKEMAKRLGISQVAYNNLENGRTNLDINRLLKVGEVLDLNVFDLLRQIATDKSFNILQNEHKECKTLVDQFMDSYGLIIHHKDKLWDAFDDIKKYLHANDVKNIKNELGLLSSMISIFLGQLKYMEAIVTDKYPEVRKRKLDADASNNQ
jgi:transcriptional regulator with XRE-family HTH domain